MPPPRAPRIVLITDPRYGDEWIVHCVAAAARALPRGALAVQLRDKKRHRASLRLFAHQLRAVTRAAGAWLLVNRDAEVARDSGADGVHLGHDAASVAQARAVVGRACWISVAAHAPQDVAAARHDGADAVLVSPVFATASTGPTGGTKVPGGLALLRSARAEAGPGMVVYALGGVTPTNARACAAAGADGAAGIRALLDGTEPGRAACALHDAWAGRW